VPAPHGRRLILLCRKRDILIRILCIRFGSWSERLDDVQTTFSFGGAGPAAGPGVFSRTDGSGAMGAAYARVVLVVQGVIGHSMIVEVAPDLF
jgi:hypothetical protein